MSKARVAWCAITLAGLALAACSAKQLGLPRRQVEVASPDGRMLAWVANQMSLDPPAQSLWLGAHDGGEPKLLQRLAEDQDWCNQIVWSPDSSMVVFLVQDARAVVADAVRRQVLTEGWLVEPENHPTTSIASDVAFAADGSELVYRECPRSGGACSAERTFPLPATGVAAG